jgi:UDP-glucose 4-epimerase
MRTHVITGGAGFIGSHLADTLLERGERVVAIDDLSTGTLDNLAHRRGHPNLRIVVESVLKETVLNALIQQVDGAVYHLAAAVGVRLIVEKPARVIETNILGTSAVLHCCRRHGVPLFIASTSEVYGKLKASSFNEDADMLLGPTTRSRWSYACSKAIDEFMALAFARDYALPVVVGRFFNTTGPRQTGQYGMVVPRFVRQALAGDPLTVYGSGAQTRCFAHVRDIVAGVMALMETPAAHGQIVNLGTEESVSIDMLAQRVKEAAGSASPIVHVPFEEAYEAGFEDIEDRRPDLSKARRLIGFKPRLALSDILRDVIEWERKPKT